MLRRLTRCQRRQPASILTDKCPNFSGSAACIIAKRPADCLANKEVFLMCGAESVCEKPSRVSLIAPAKLVKNGNPPDPQIWRLQCLIHFALNIRLVRTSVQN